MAASHDSGDDEQLPDSPASIPSASHNTRSSLRLSAILDDSVVSPSTSPPIAHPNTDKLTDVEVLDAPRNCVECQDQQATVFCPNVLLPLYSSNAC